jgi:hypothetical protein
MANDLPLINEIFEETKVDHSLNQAKLHPINFLNLETIEAFRSTEIPLN